MNAECHLLPAVAPAAHQNPGVEGARRGLYAMNADDELMVQYRQGDPEAFAELFRRYRGPVHAFFRRRLDDGGRAEELAQETLLAVLRGAARYEPRGQFRSYLFRIAMNLAAAERRKNRHETIPLQEAGLSSTSDPDAVLWVRGALARLDQDAREILMLREYEQLSYSEIAAVFRIPINTVRSRLFRARMALKESLAPQRAIGPQSRPVVQAPVELFHRLGYSLDDYQNRNVSFRASGLGMV